jgi:dolichol-phosphate mannosyltransferase
MQTTLSRLWQIVRFCIAGAAGVIAYYTALYCLTEYLGIWYILSSIVGFILNQTIGFVLHKFWTFKDKNTEYIRGQAFKYLMRGICTLGANSLLLYLLVDCFHLWYVGAQMLLTIILTLVNYIISKRIFKPKGKEKE